MRTNNSGTERLPDTPLPEKPLADKPLPEPPLPGKPPRLAGRYIENPRQAFAMLKSKFGSIAKRAGLHFLALIAGGIIADGLDSGEQTMLFYFGAICLLPRGFSPRDNAYLFPAVLSFGQLAITLYLGYQLPLAVFLAGTQNWLQRAVIRRFRLGLDWVLALFLLSLFVQSLRTYGLPLPFFTLTAVCGLGAYCAAQMLDRRKLARLEAEALARSENASPFKIFYLSLTELEAKADALPKDLQASARSIARYGRNILDCMGKDPAVAQPGSRFLGRYLPAAHKLADDYTRLEREGRGYEDIQSVLGRVDETLERLAQAFQQEHASFLSSNARQLSAEMQVLDKLLKMDGR